MPASMTAQQAADSKKAIGRFLNRFRSADEEPGDRLELGRGEALEERIGAISRDFFEDAVATLNSLDGSPDEGQALHGLGKPRNLGGYIVRAFQKRICGNAEVSEEIKQALEDAKKQGVTVGTPTMTSITTGTAMIVSMAVLSAFSGPIAVAVAPLAGGVALMLMQSGLDGFCAWVNDAD